MHKKGHVGFALIAYAPVVILTLLIIPDFWGLTAVGLPLVFWLSVFPDIDLRIPGVPHRGPTHTIWFGLGVGVFFAFLTYIGYQYILNSSSLTAFFIVGGIASTLVLTISRVNLKNAAGIGFAVAVLLFGQFALGGAGTESLLEIAFPNRIATSVYIGGVAAFGTLSHLLGDVVTPMGITPFTPYKDTKYTLDLVKAKNPIANIGMYILGILTISTAYIIAIPQLREFVMALIA